MPFITKEGLKHLDSYKYKSGGYSKLDNIMNPFWEWVEKIIPRSMAPNTVTLIGFIFMAASYFCMLYYDDTFTKEMPRWVYIFAAVCQFIYQTMDAVDGKHARTTQASSPLGQLFDHGCDSFSVTFLILAICQTLRLGPTNELLFFSGLIQLGFFTANWVEYHVGVLTTNITYFGVTEAQFMIISILSISGIFGPATWDASIADLLGVAGVNLNLQDTQPWLQYFLTIGMKHIILKSMYVVIYGIFICFFLSTLVSAKDKFFALSQFIPVAGLLGAVCFWSSIPVFQDEPALILLSSALIFSLVTSKLIICSLTKMKTPIFQVEVLVFFLCGVFMKFYATNTLSKHFNDIILYILPAYVIVSVVIWSKGVIQQIASFLGNKNKYTPEDTRKSFTPPRFKATKISTKDPNLRSQKEQKIYA